MCACGFATGNAALNKILEKRTVQLGNSEFRCIFVNGDYAIPIRILGAEESTPELKIRQIDNVFLEKMVEGGKWSLP
ncbi:MAG: hypothetical protein IJR99_00200 [Kiritimatiellae bacterium]|nr:hypothetical protein [Kiritimatiellia bacterium]